MISKAAFIVAYGGDIAPQSGPHLSQRLLKGEGHTCTPEQLRT